MAKQRAERVCAGNSSAVTVEVGEDAMRFGAMDRYFEKYQVAPLADEDRARVDAELAGAIRSRSRKNRT